MPTIAPSSRHRWRRSSVCRSDSPRATALSTGSPARAGGHCADRARTWTAAQLRGRSRGQCRCSAGRGGAASAGLVFLRVDALHMLAIADAGSRGRMDPRGAGRARGDRRPADPAVGRIASQQRRLGAFRRGPLRRRARIVRTIAGCRAPLGHAAAGPVGRRGDRRGARRASTAIARPRAPSLLRGRRTGDLHANSLVLTLLTSAVLGRSPMRRAHPPRTARSADADQLLVHELVGGEQPHLTAGAAALDAAEGQLGRVRQNEVDVDHAGLDLVGDRARPAPRPS